MRMRRQSDRNACKSLNATILSLHNTIVRLDQNHFPTRVAESRLDKFIEADKQRRNHA